MAKPTITVKTTKNGKVIGKSLLKAAQQLHGHYLLTGHTHENGSVIHIYECAARIRADIEAPYRLKVKAPV